MSGQQTIYKVLDACGVNALFRVVNRHKIRIFALHGVANYRSEVSWTPLRPQMDTGLFRECMTALRRNYEFISLDEAMDMLAGSVPMRSGCAVLTFDDGYLNNFTEALPVLVELGLPATFYVATDPIIERTPFWFDRLDFAVQAAAAQGMPIALGEYSFETEGLSRSGLIEHYFNMRAYAKKTIRDERKFVDALDSLATELEGKTGQRLVDQVEDDPWAGIVSVKELRSASENKLVTIGSHTRKHLRLACADEAERRLELSESKVRIEEWTGKTCRHFSYPNGEFDDLSQSLVGETGYSTAVTTVLGMNEVGCDLTALKRMNVFYDAPLTNYLSRASGLELFIHNLKRAISSLKPGAANKGSN